MGVETAKKTAEARGDSGRETGGESEESGGGGNRWRWMGVVLAGIILLAVLGFVALRELAYPSIEPIAQIADVSSERLLALGSVVGFAAEHDTHAWLGMPYARPPVDALRWRAPRDPEAWADTLDALSFGSPCVQLASQIGGVPSEDPDGLAGSEDCLYLNVWAPRSEPERVVPGASRLPVMVWFHGGGNRIGHSGSAMYNGARLAGSQQVAVVSFNYRLGPFGWFSHRGLRASAENGLEASGNFGTLDQVRALEWVQSNVSEFGGDPHNVTIFGESAGGTNVLAMLLIDSARGLFQRAIVQSGSTDSVSRGEAENEVSAQIPGQRHSSAEIVVALLEEAGVVPDRDAARGYAASLLDADLADFLLGRSAREIMEVYRDPDRPTALEVPRLIRDGALLPTSEWNTEFREGRFNRVPIMLGSNRDEMKLTLFADEDHVRQRFGIFFRILDPEDYERRARYHSDLRTIRGVTRPASAFSHAGLAEVFAYRFDWDELPSYFGGDLSVLLGAAHGFELPFVFGTFDLGDPFFNRLIFDEQTAATRESLSAKMMSYWAEFARNGRPGRGSEGDLPNWDPWTPGTAIGEQEAEVASMIIFDTEAGGGIRIAETRLSRDQVIAAVDAEPELGQGEKCDLFHDLFFRRPEWTAETYRRIGQLGCAEHPRE